MFFFFVGGVDQQVSRVLKYGVSRCINCGSMADLVEYDKVVKAFFIPVWKRHAKEPALYCNNCNFLFPETMSLPPPPPPPASEVSDTLRCRFCDRLVEPEFRFCPFCGSSL